MNTMERLGEEKRAATESKLKEIELTMGQNAKEKIQKHSDNVKLQLKAALSEIEIYTNEQKAKLERIYSQNKEKWVSDITGRIVRDDGI